MNVIRHPRHADRVMRVEGTLAVAGVGGGLLLWSQAAHFGGYGFAAAAFLSLGGVRSGVRALHNYNRYRRGADGEEAVLTALREMTGADTAIANFVVPGTRQGDTDLILLGPFGVLVLEVKAYTGHYACHGDAWFAVRADGSRQPLRGGVSRQLKRNRKAVQHYLVDCEVNAPVHAAAVFRPNVRLDLSQPTVPIIRQSELAEFVAGLPPARQPFPRADLEALFTPPGGRTSSPERSGSESPAAVR